MLKNVCRGSLHKEPSRTPETPGLQKYINRMMYKKQSACFTLSLMSRISAWTQEMSEGFCNWKQSCRALARPAHLNVCHICTKGTMNVCSESLLPVICLQILSSLSFSSEYSLKAPAVILDIIWSFIDLYISSRSLKMSKLYFSLWKLVSLFSLSFFWIPCLHFFWSTLLRKWLHE